MHRRNGSKARCAEELFWTRKRLWGFLRPHSNLTSDSSQLGQVLAHVVAASTKSSVTRIRHGTPTDPGVPHHYSVAGRAQAAPRYIA